ncbi:MAG TPA: diadenylate cyclase [Vicinamibacteria bacterium]|nr:diadenylate cyclase [Vicinamibacteria bacterium]
MSLWRVLASLLDEAADVAVVTVAVFVLLRTLRSSRARLALLGVAVVGLIDLAARQLGLPLTAWFFQGLFLVSAVVLVLAFQDDLKRFFERLAVLGLGRRSPTPEEGPLEVVVRASFGLAAARRGALIVLPGRDPLEARLEGGFPLDGSVSEPLLLSLFDPHSPGHDGAAVVTSALVRRFGVHLPLSSDFAQLGLHGTRHAAALGLSEQSDAFCVAVSEEHGSVSVARAGRLRAVEDPDALRRALRAFVDETRPRPAPALSWPRVLARFREWGVALAISAGLWLLVVPGSEMSETTLTVPVEIGNLPAGYSLESVTPGRVVVTLTGVRRRLFVLGPSDVTVSVDALLAQLGRRTFDLTPQSVRAPRGVTVASVQPDHVSLALRVPLRDGGPAKGDP